MTTTILSGIALSSSNSLAVSTATASVRVVASCTMSSTGGGSYSATVPNGTNSIIEGSTLSVTCNDANGFALYAVGYSNDTVGNNNMIGPSANIPSDMQGSGSYWAMKVNPTTGNTPTIENSFDDFHNVPNVRTKVASYNQSTGASSLSVKATYKASISSAQLAGNYLGKVKYTLVHPVNEVLPHEVTCEAGKICYNPNTVAVEGQVAQQTPTSSQLTDGITLYASNYKRDGYGFAGWSDAYDYDTNPNAHFYGPNQTITAPSNFSTDGLSLYAVWISSAGTIQNWNSCSSLTQDPHDGTATLSSITALTDERDSNTYAVARLADGKCWMIENLRLDHSPELSSTNTNNPSLPLTNIYDLGTTSNHLSPTTSAVYDATNAPEGWTRGGSTDTPANTDASRLRTDNTVLFTNIPSSSNYTWGSLYSYGNYYNWYSATAGHGTWSKNSGNTAGDICPAGWHLPRGGNKSQESNNEFWALIVTGLNGGINPANYDSFTSPYYRGDAEAKPVSNKIRSYPNNFVYSGYVIGGGGIYNRGLHGDYWSSTANSNSSLYASDHGMAFDLEFLTYEDVYPGTGTINYKYYGRTVRCIAGV